MIPQKIIELSTKYSDEIIRIRRKIHSRPELDFDLGETADTIETVLTSLGLSSERFAGTGVVSLLVGNGSRRTVAIRADMDALPIHEENLLSYKSEIEGKMHACGHDAHIAIALGAAMILSCFQKDLRGNVKFIFQPAEETSGGALPMIKEGVLKGPAVENIFSLHVMPELERGKVGVRSGKMRAASDMFDITVKGISCHGAEPERGIDPIIIASKIVDILQTLISRSVSPLDSAVITVGQIQGGMARNIVAQSVTLSGVIRTVDPSTRRNLLSAVRQVVDSICTSMGGEGKVLFTEGYPCLNNDPEMTDIVERASLEIMGRKSVQHLERPSMGVDDFAYFLERIPGCYFMLGVGDPEGQVNYPLHNPFFQIDERALAPASALLARICLLCLESKK